MNKLHIEFDSRCQSVDTYVNDNDQLTLFSKDNDGISISFLVPPSADNGRFFKKKFHITVEEDA